MPRLLAFLILCAPLAAHAGALKLKTQGWKLRFALQSFEPRYAPPVSEGHLKKKTTSSRDACRFVAGVRHCPLPRLPE